MQRTAKVPGQMKLSFVQSIPKEPEVSIMVHLIKFLSNYQIFILSNCYQIFLDEKVNPIQDVSFWGYSQMGRGKTALLPKICHTCPKMMKLGTVIPSLKKIQKT